MLSAIHPIKITFGIPFSAEKTLERFVYSYVLEGDGLCFIDTGVAGSENQLASILENIGKSFADVRVIVLTHSHPDHIGAARPMREMSGAQVWAHANEKEWIEDTERQRRERPVPGFDRLVSGPVSIDRMLHDNERISLCGAVNVEVLHTPGHSSGSISLWAQDNGVLFCGDVIPEPASMPIYEDVVALLKSLHRLLALEGIKVLYSSWTDPAFDQQCYDTIRKGIKTIARIHQIVLEAVEKLAHQDPMELCRHCVSALGLAPFAVNPLVARSFTAHVRAAKDPEIKTLIAI